MNTDTGLLRLAVTSVLLFSIVCNIGVYLPGSAGGLLLCPAHLPFESHSPERSQPLLTAHAAEGPGCHQHHNPGTQQLVHSGSVLQLVTSQPCITRLCVQSILLRHTQEVVQDLGFFSFLLVSYTVTAICLLIFVPYPKLWR